MRAAARLAVCAALLASAGARAQFTVVNGYPYLRTTVPGTDRCLAWNTRHIVYLLDSAGSARTPAGTELAAVNAAFSTWQAVADSCSDMQFTNGGFMDNAPVGYLKDGPNQNVVVFRETACRDSVPFNDPCFDAGDCANRYHCWDYPDFTIGLTTTTFSFRTGNILDADIELNASLHFDGSFFLFTTVSSPPCTPDRQGVDCVATDVQNTMTHEIGHLTGLGHVIPEDPRLHSTMEPTADVGETTKRVVDIGSASAFCNTYPRNLPATSCDDLGLITRRVIAHNRGIPGFGCSAGGLSGAGGPFGGAGTWLAVVAWGMLRAHARSHARRRGARGAPAGRRK
ncbi:MAG TPA: myxosortase-dependent metalloprotease, MXAN_2677/MXAN_2678 family [Myxococcales bacterium]|nr:myxosortase-dependent metalloprotease, MXAN_2677/MXAN_2678 family [Myxococcales bacterium]